MSFIRSFDNEQVEKLTSKRYENLFNKLKTDIFCGNPNKAVFPAIRKNEIDFYYKGGCLYKFSCGIFMRNNAYKNYSDNTDSLDEYEMAKKQNENKHTNVTGSAKERNLLNELYYHTFDPNCNIDTVVLDIEVNLNGNIGAGKKCDLVLFNTVTLEIMFVEGKVFFDHRVNVKCGCTPKVVQQVNLYSDAILEQEETILNQYCEYVRIIDDLFNTHYKFPLKVITPAKLLVYDTPLVRTDNQNYSIDTINNALGKGNVLWCEVAKRPTTDEIWRVLCK